MTTLEKIKQMKQDYKTLVSQEGKTLVKELLTTFFSEAPDVESVRWAQYTPYFNDGDACVFSVNEPKVMFFEGKTPELKYEPEDEEEYIDSWSLKDGPVSEAIGKLGEALNGIEDVLKETLGDHSEITATRTSVEVEEYEHD